VIFTSSFGLCKEKEKEKEKEKPGNYRLQECHRRVQKKSFFLDSRKSHLWKMHFVGSGERVHYQKFAKYQRIYRRNISVGNLRSKLPTETFSSVIQLVTTDGPVSVCNSVGNYPSVLTDRITDGKVSELKKGRSLMWRFWRVIFV